MTQKFFRGDLVRIADDLGPSMSHFESGVDAVVIASYAEQYGGNASGETKFTLYILPNIGEVSWYNEEQLTLISEDGWKKLPSNHIVRRNAGAKMARHNNS